MKGLESRIRKIERMSRPDIQLTVGVSTREEIDEKVEKLRERFGFEGYVPPDGAVVSWLICTDRDGNEHLEFRTPLVPKNRSEQREEQHGQGTGKTSVEEGPVR